MTTNNIPTDNTVSKIKEARKKAKITQEELADRYQIPLRTLQSWELNERKPPEYLVAMVLRLMAIDFGITPGNTETDDTPRTSPFTYVDGKPLSEADLLYVRSEAKRIEIEKTDDIKRVNTYRCPNGLLFKAKQKG